MKSLVLQHRAWRHLLPAILKHPSLARVRFEDSDILKKLLVAPVTLAYWIASEQPQLLERDSLRIVIAGAARGLDSVDYGRWYSILGHLLSIDIPIEVVMVGPELEASAAHPELRTGTERSGILVSRLSKAIAQLPPAGFIPDSLGNWTHNQVDQPPADACFLFHPGFEAFSGAWFSQEHGFADLHKSGVPLGFASSCVEELWQEDWLTLQYGYARANVARANPYAIERDNPKFGGQWGGIVWSLSDKRPPDGFKEPKPEIMRFNLAMQQAKPGFSVAGNAVFAFIGGVFPIRNTETGEVATLVGTPAGIAVCVQSGRVFGQTDDGQFVVAERIPRVEEIMLRSFPGEAAHPVDRMIWATELFQGLIEPFLFSGGSSAPEAYEDLFGAPLGARTRKLEDDPGAVTAHLNPDSLGVS